MNAEEARELTDEVVAAHKAEAERVYTSRMREVERNRKLVLQDVLFKIKLNAEKGYSQLSMVSGNNAFQRRRNDLLAADLSKLGYGVSRDRPSFTITW